MSDSSQLTTKTIPVEDAVGTVLVHDITRVIPDESKGVAFKKGHIIREQDIPDLLTLGKKSLYILELSENEIHENDAAIRIAPAISGEGLTWSEPSEGKSKIVSPCNGLLKVNVEGLTEINRIDDVIVSTLKNGTICEQGQTVAATRIIPLTTATEHIEEVESVAKKYAPILEIKPFKKLRYGAVITGSEIKSGRAKNGFDHFVGKKVEAYGCERIKMVLADDDAEEISQAIKDLKDLDCELILTTGGLSVDPDDVTREGVRMTGAEIISYGAPVLPGAMFLYARLGDVEILGLPAAVFYFPASILDLMLPRVLAGEEITRDFIINMGHGGLCLDCKVCHFPICPFGG